MPAPKAWRWTRCGWRSEERMSTSLQKDLVMVAAAEGNDGDGNGGTWRRLTAAGRPAGGRCARNTVPNPPSPSLQPAVAARSCS
jgi:hypothetical protein